MEPYIRSLSSSSSPILWMAVVVLVIATECLSPVVAISNTVTTTPWLSANVSCVLDAPPVTNVFDSNAFPGIVCSARVDSLEANITTTDEFLAQFNVSRVWFAIQLSVARSLALRVDHAELFWETMLVDSNFSIEANATFPVVSMPNIPCADICLFGSSFAGDGLWTITPTLVVTGSLSTTVVSNSSDVSSAVTECIAVNSKVIHSIIRPNSSFAQDSINATLRPSNNSLVQRGDQLQLRTSAALLPHQSCFAQYVQDGITSSSSVVPLWQQSNTSSSLPLVLSSILSFVNVQSGVVTRTEVDVTVVCAIPTATLEILQLELLEWRQQIMTNNSSSSSSTNVILVLPPITVMPSTFLSFVIPTSVYFILPKMPVVTLSALEDVSTPSIGGGSSIVPSVVIATLADLTGGGGQRGWNVTDLFYVHQITPAIFVVVFPSVTSVNLAAQLAARSDTTFTIFPGNKTTISIVEDGCVCAYSQLLIRGEPSTLSPSTMTCSVYHTPVGISIWVYEVIGGVLAVLFGIMLLDDLITTIPKRSLSSHRHSDKDPIDRRTPTVVGEDSNYDNEIASSSSYRAFYIRFCGIIAAIWDVGGIVVNLCFIAYCLPTLRHLNFLLVMIVVVLVTMVTITVKVHVTLNSMPSRVYFRRHGSSAQRKDLGSPFDGLGALDHRNDGSRKKMKRKSMHRLDRSSGGGTAGATTVVQVPTAREANSSRREELNSDCDRAVRGKSFFNRISHYPVASHFWPFVNVLVLLADDVDVEIKFTSIPRTFWFGVQRWVQDVPALVVVSLFIAWHPLEANAAAIAQLFFSAAGIAFGYRGFLTAAAVPVILVASWCASTTSKSAMSEWIKMRVGLFMTSSDAPTQEEISDLGRAMATLTSHPRTLSGTTVLFNHSRTTTNALAGNSTSDFSGAFGSSTSVPPQPNKMVLPLHLNVNNNRPSSSGGAALPLPPPTQQQGLAGSNSATPHLQIPQPHQNSTTAAAADVAVVDVAQDNAQTTPASPCGSCPTSLGGSIIEATHSSAIAAPLLVVDDHVQYYATILASQLQQETAARQMQHSRRTSPLADDEDTMVGGNSWKYDLSPSGEGGSYVVLPVEYAEPHPRRESDDRYGFSVDRHHQSLGGVRTDEVTIHGGPASHVVDAADWTLSGTSHL